MDEPTRRAWSRPELIVLVRSGPEEAVLAGCKSPAGIVYEHGTQALCRTTYCELCSGEGSS